MTTYFTAFLLAAMSATVLTIVVRNRAHRHGWCDRARSSRTIHAGSVPRLGGIAIVLGFLAPLTALLVVDSGVGQTYREHPDLIRAIFGGGAAIALLGLWDDFRGLGAKEKFAVQFVVAFWLWQLGFRVETIANPFGPALPLGPLALPFTLLWIVGVVNAMNLIDGLDGLAGGVAFFGVATNFALAAARGDVLLCLMMASLGGAIAGFLFFNFNPASIFMGDTGSMFLGFVLAAVSIKTSSKSHTSVAMLVPVIALGLPIMDTLLAMSRRAIVGRSMFSADKEHIHHRLMSRLGVTHRRAVLVLYAICCLFGLTALSLAYANGVQTAMLLTGLAAVVAVLMRKLGYLTRANAADAAKVRKKNGELRFLVRELSSRIRGAHDLQSLWNAVRPVAEIVDASDLELRLERQMGAVHDGILFEIRHPGGTALPVVHRLDVVGRGERLGRLTIVWRDGRPEADRDEELALASIADAIGDSAYRFVAPNLEPAPDLVASG